jgi:acetyl-CoA carboxylase biotin carboxylase subunit
MTSGLDIVQEQIKVAQGCRLEIDQAEVRCTGHSIESRINAEDPDSFLPSAGMIGRLTLPEGEGVRVDTHIHEGYRVSPYYDSLIAKLIVHAPNRPAAIARMREALAATEIDGISTNLAFLRALFDDEAFASGGTDIHYLEQWLARRRST